MGIVKSKRVCLANGDEFDNVEIDLNPEMRTKFISIVCGSKLIKVNPDFIISFEVSPIKAILK